MAQTITTDDIVSAFIFVALFTQQSVCRREFRILRTESGQSHSLGGGRLGATDSGQFLVHMAKKKPASYTSANALIADSQQQSQT